MKLSAIITLSLLALAILLCFLLPGRVVERMRQQTKEAFGPVLRGADGPARFFSQMNAQLQTLDQAQAEAARLRRQVAELTVQNQILIDKAAENKRLREAIGFREASQYRLRACRVVSREPSSWWDSVQVNVGWADDPDLARDQPVVSPRGVIGKTGNVSKYVTDVILMVSQNCSISAVVQTGESTGFGPGTNNRDQGVVQGEGNFEEGRTRVRIHYLPKDTRVKEGDFVLTSGLGPYFPPGLRLGQLRSVPALSKAYPSFGTYRDADLEPTADLNQLDELFIVLGSKLAGAKDAPSGG